MRNLVGAIIASLNKPNIRLATASSMRMRLLHTSSPTVPPPLTSINLETEPLPQCEIDAAFFRKKLEKNRNDLDALYGLAMSIEQGAIISKKDIYNIGSPVQIEIYRKILKYDLNHSKAMWGLAQCLKKGDKPRITDLCGTWLANGYWMLEDGSWGLTPKVKALLIQALEKQSIEIKNAKTAITRGHKRYTP